MTTWVRILHEIKRICAVAQELRCSTTPSWSAMKSLLTLVALALSLAGCATVRDTQQATLVLDATSICMLSWSERWWVEGDFLYAGRWSEGMKPPRGYALRAVVRITPSEKKQLLLRLSWLEHVEAGTHDVQFKDPGAHLKLTSSPSYAIDYRAPSGRRIIVGDDPIGAIEPVLDLLNSALPVSSRINWQVTSDAYVLNKRAEEPPQTALSAKVNSSVVP